MQRFFRWSLLLLLPLAGQLNRRALFAGFRVHALRAHVHLAGILCMVVALEHLPLATANAVFYAAPFLVMVLSVPAGASLTATTLMVDVLAEDSSSPSFTTQEIVRSDVSGVSEKLL